MNLTQIEEIIAAYPICQYGILDTEELIFSEMVRHICESDCVCCGTTWSCPPAVGTVEECRERCIGFEKVLIFTTLAEVSDTALLDETLKTRKGHEEVSRSLLKELKGVAGEDLMALSSESCQLCEHCTFPNSTCRYPDSMLPCIESYGILVTESAEKCQIDFFYDNTTVTWFGMIFFDKKGI